ncbi:prepilin peptidase [Candidatus Woesearchaeota archaeon]|nr:prepilin peptidase [Candidatus Woesearchaeota archaeon]HIH37854.1 hypothetical protein [Candidatus Woesearchaeota archaeon]HIJ03979.1 hypothetical protein [Candidatus Woesearchaeota archaeon]
MNEYIFLGCIIILGILSSFSDIRFGKIRNKATYSFMVIGVLLYVFFGKDDLSRYMINLFSAVIFSVALWLLRWWSAGDVKLFVAFNAIIPSMAFSFTLLPFFFVFLLTVTPLFLILILHAVITEHKNILSASFLIKPLKRLPGVLVSVFGLSWLIALLLQYLRLPQSPILVLVWYMLLYPSLSSIIRRLMKKASLHERWEPAVYIILGLCGMFIEKTNILLVLIVSAASIITRLLVYDLSFIYATKEKALKDLQQGDIIADLVIEGDVPVPAKVLPSEGRLPEGILKEDIKKLKKFVKDKRLKIKILRVQKTMPFAPSLFAGMLLFIIIMFIKMRVL